MRIKGCWRSFLSHCVWAFIYFLPFANELVCERSGSQLSGPPGLLESTVWEPNAHYHFWCINQWKNSKFLRDHNENTEGRGWRLLEVLWFVFFFVAQSDVWKGKKKCVCVRARVSNCLRLVQKLIQSWCHRGIRGDSDSEYWSLVRDFWCHSNHLNTWTPNSRS